MDIHALLKKMTLREKLAQMTQIHACKMNPETLSAQTGPDSDLKLTESDLFACGSVLNACHPHVRKQIQALHLAHDPHKIPLLFMQDVIHGHRTMYPVPLAMGATFNPALTEDCAEMAAKEAAASGVDVCFSPMADLCRDARWGRITETTGEDPYLNSEMAKAFVRGYQKEGRTAACVKHFAAYGAAEGGRDYNTVDLSLRTLHESYLKAYKAAIEEGAKMVMSSFNTLNGIPAAGNRYLMNDVLRNLWGFDGCVVTDYNAVQEMICHGFAENEKECALHAISCNNDWEMMSSTYVRYGEELVKAGRLTEAQIDQIVLRILKLKDELGLFENPNRFTDEEEFDRLSCCKSHLALCKKAAVEGCVLLQNDGTLPLTASGKKIAVVGPFANSRAILGAWTIMGEEKDTVSLAEGLQALSSTFSAADQFTVHSACSDRLGERDITKVEEAVLSASKADVIIAALGESQADSGEGASRVALRLSPAQTHLLSRLHETGKPVICVIFAGRPLVLGEVLPLCNALLYAWHPGTMGGAAIADLLYGVENPSGKTTASFPRAEGQLPLYYNHYRTGRYNEKDPDPTPYTSYYKDCPNAPLFPFGYGLSYTTFSIEALTLSKSEMKRGEAITATARVKNTGTRAGKIALQWYVRDQFGSCVRPVLELKGFEKITLAAGEEKTVTFTVTEETLAFYNDKLEFVAEVGDFDLFFGTSSAEKDLLSVPFRLTE